eukprot:TRINITY_DN82518_c0_g1_i1.p1 TRINITY_DN82518_c0_g1~~TRINITY_DN82518_c0_g1_i1.p1  ORF type:complete len:150 (+),score=25.41 TRINITY_DN82518_c0_g1_i1:56-451(+)
MAPRSRCSWCPCASRRGCCRRCGRRLWSMVPLRWQEQLKPYYAQLKFFLMCAHWAISFVWEDRHELLSELRAAIAQDVWGVDEAPPLRHSEVKDELRPFRHMLVAAFLCSLMQMTRKVAWSEAPPMDLTLS